jgi:hypothetical protein
VLGAALERSVWLASRLLASDTVFGWVQQALFGSLVARKAFDRQVGRVLSGANVPSLQDLDRLLERMDRIDGELDELVRRVEALHGRLSTRDEAGALPPHEEGW